MIAFLLVKNKERWLGDYLNHTCDYLKEFDLHADIIKYTPGYGPQIPDKYETIIFVQQIEQSIMRQFTANTPKNVPPLARKSSFGIKKPLNITTPGMWITQVPTIERDYEKQRRVFVLNTEQATVSKYTNNFVASVRRYNLPVIDYSLENILLLQKQLPTTTFIHFPFPIKFQINKEKVRDVISLLSSPHRKQICNGLGVPVCNFLGKWGRDRDNLVKNSKLLVNLHHNPSEYRIFESIRCYHALELGTLVISEHSVNEDALLLGDMIIFCHPREMKEKVQEILKNYDEIYAKTFSAENIANVEKRMYDTFKENIDKMFAMEFNY